MASTITRFSCLSGRLLLLGIGLWLLAGCQQKQPSVATAPAAPPPVQAPPPKLPKPARIACALVDDEVAEDPFGAEITVTDLLAAGATIVRRRPFRNRHERNQTDTILTLRHQGNRFEFYRAPEKDLLREVTITDFQPTYGRQIQRKLNRAYRARYARRTDHCDSLRIGDSNRLNTVAMTMHDGQLEAVQVQYYVD